MKDEGGRMKTVKGTPRLRLFSSFILPPSSLPLVVVPMRPMHMAVRQFFFSRRAHL